MTRTISRRKLLQTGGGALAAVGLRVQSLPVRSVKEDYKEDFFYREDWLGEPWRKPEPVVLIHGNDESSVEWYAWVPRMAQEYRLIRPDLPGLGHSNVPRGFEYSLANLARFVTQVMDKAGVDSAHIVGAKTGGAVAMRFAADYPKRTRGLVVVGGPATPLVIEVSRQVGVWAVEGALVLGIATVSIFAWRRVSAAFSKASQMAIAMPAYFSALARPG